MASPSISIGVITLQNRAAGLGKLLEYLKPVLQNYHGDTEIVIANNSGMQAHADIEKTVSASEISQLRPIRIIDSPQNNIATGRNILLDHSKYDLLAFLDDDEYPVEQWLSELVDTMNTCDATVVAGPVPAVFHESAPRWVHTIDLHNTKGRVNGKPIEHTGTGNVLINKKRIADVRFDESFGKSGGSDTDFFLRAREMGATIYWATAAIAYEDIPPERSTARYLIHRFIKQGENYRRISLEREISGSSLAFTIKAAAVVALSLPVAGLLVLTRHPNAGDWMKRAFSNYGKLHSPNKQLYHS
jgi:succinoglycan biosynthesis protein ExoM